MKPLHTGMAMAAAVLLAISPSSADAPATGVLTVQITSLRANNGQVGCMIYDSAKGFPKDSSAALQRRWCPITNAASTCAFDPIPAGTYAVACFHDENKNGKLDTGSEPRLSESVVPKTESGTGGLL